MAGFSRLWSIGHSHVLNAESVEHDRHDGLDIGAHGFGDAVVVGAPYFAFGRARYERHI
jgi:hypothetical protein